MAADALSDAFGRRDLTVRTDEGRVLAIRFSGRRHGTPEDAAHVEVQRQQWIQSYLATERIEMEDSEIRAALDLHWAASDASDFELEHKIYREDAVLEYPQSGERIRGRRNIQTSRAAQPSKKRFTVRRILGDGDLWITEFILTYDGRPSYTVSIMELKAGKVARETQYFGDSFAPGPSRAQWVERMR